MPEILRFSTNIPEIVSLRFAEGKLKPSTLPNTPPDVMFTLGDGRAMYLPTSAAEEIYRNRIRPNTPIQVCRRAGGRFEITPMGVESPAASASASHGTNAPAPATHQQMATGAPTADGQQGNTPPATKYMGAYAAAIDTLIEAKAYAQRHGLALEIRCEDVRCLAATMMIDQQRGGAR